MDPATGVPWRGLSECFGPWQTVYEHFRNRRRSGVFASVVEVFRSTLDNEGRIDWELWCVYRAHLRAAAGADWKVSAITPANQPTSRWAAAVVGLDRSSSSRTMAGQSHSVTPLTSVWSAVCFRPGSTFTRDGNHA